MKVCALLLILFLSLSSSSKRIRYKSVLGSEPVDPFEGPWKLLGAQTDSSSRSGTLYSTPVESSLKAAYYSRDRQLLEKEFGRHFYDKTMKFMLSCLLSSIVDTLVFGNELKLASPEGGGFPSSIDARRFAFGLLALTTVTYNWIMLYSRGAGLPSVKTFGLYLRHADMFLIFCVIWMFPNTLDNAFLTPLLLFLGIMYLAVIEIMVEK